MKTNVIKNVLIIALGICTSFGFTSCEKNNNVEQKKSPTITQGVYGYTSDGESPIAVDVYVYEYTKISDFEERYHSLNDFPIDKMPKAFIAKTTSDKDGFYEIALQPGKYSLFLLNGDMLYANNFDSESGICPIEVVAESVIQKDLILSK